MLKINDLPDDDIFNKVIMMIMMLLFTLSVVVILKTLTKIDFCDIVKWRRKWFVSFSAKET